MPIAVANTTLSLSQIDQLREIVLQTNVILGTTLDPFTLENLNKSDWWQYEFTRQVLSTTLVAEGYPALPEFSISDLNNGELPTVLIEYINTSLVGGGSQQTLTFLADGAVETADGIYQRFSHNGEGMFGASGYTLSLIEGDWRSSMTVQLVAPTLTNTTQFISIAFTDSPDFANLPETNFAKFEILTDGVSGNPTAQLSLSNETNLQFALPTAGDSVVIECTQNLITASYGELTQSLPLPTGFIAPVFNCLVGSVDTAALDVLDISIRATGAPAGG